MDVPLVELPASLSMKVFDDAYGCVGGQWKTVLLIDGTSGHAKDSLQCAAVRADEDALADVLQRDSVEEILYALLEAHSVLSVRHGEVASLRREHLQNFWVLLREHVLVSPVVDTAVPFA